MRISGPYSSSIFRTLCGRTLPQPRRAVLRRVCDAEGRVLDQAMVLWLPGPQTSTGQDMAELHLHGGRAVIAAVSEALMQAGARPADGGEFSRRAFLAGRVDLLQAEGVADLIAAETELQRRQAMRQMQGEQSALLQDWRARMMRALAFAEVLIDFPDEDLPPQVEADMLADLASLHADLASHLAAAAQGVRLRDGLVFAIVGAPNVGKSSLLNALARREAAIVSPRPGTTRDLIEVQVDFGGVPVTLVDTAGLRETGDPIEMEGVRRALARRQSADLSILVVDATAPVMADPDALCVANKCDVAPAPPGMLAVSARTGAGLASLETSLAEHARRLTAGLTHPVLNQARHVSALRDACDALSRAHAAPLAELRAEDLRTSMRALGRITGEVDAESVLDVVFGSFCIGK
jgi:tRNA modification GTPase